MKIELVDWEWECGDGCCYESGTELIIDGKSQLSNVIYNEAELIRTILEYVGITDFTIEETNED